MRRVSWLSPVAAALVLGGCATRSIANSGYAESRGYYSYAPAAPRKDAPILAIQSGAAIPDEPMVAALDRYFAVIPFSGVQLAGHEITAEKLASADEAQGYGHALRLIAAGGGADLIFCYWGAPESASQDEATTGISWLPVIGGVIPDQTQHMRIPSQDRRHRREDRQLGDVRPRALHRYRAERRRQSRRR